MWMEAAPASPFIWVTAAPRPLANGCEELEPVLGGSMPDGAPWPLLVGRRQDVGAVLPGSMRRHDSAIQPFGLETPSFSALRHAGVTSTLERPLQMSDSTMSCERRKSLLRYAAGLSCTFFGAWLTDVTGSMLPLALGASASLVCTLPLVKAILSGDKRRGRTR